MYRSTYMPHLQEKNIRKRKIGLESPSHQSGEVNFHNTIYQENLTVPILNSQNNKFAGSSNLFNVSHSNIWDRYMNMRYLPVQEEMRWHMPSYHRNPNEFSSLHQFRQEIFHNRMMALERNLWNDPYFHNSISASNQTMPNQNKHSFPISVMNLGCMTPSPTDRNNPFTNMDASISLAISDYYNKNNQYENTSILPQQGFPQRQLSGSTTSSLSSSDAYHQFKGIKMDTKPQGYNTTYALRKPFSGYNIFFSYDREIILALLPNRATCNQSPIAQFHASLQKSNKSNKLTLSTMDITEETKEADVEFYINLIETSLAERTKNDIDLIFKMAKQNCEKRLASIYEVDKPKKSHRKSHGKISFSTLSKLISRRWHKLSLDEKSYYHDKANSDRKRYNQEMRQGSSKCY